MRIISMRTRMGRICMGMGIEGADRKQVTNLRQQNAILGYGHGQGDGPRKCPELATNGWGWSQAKAAEGCRSPRRYRENRQVYD
jgi:hypothetical protein